MQRGANEKNEIARGDTMMRCEWLAGALLVFESNKEAGALLVSANALD